MGAKETLIMAQQCCNALLKQEEGTKAHQVNSTPSNNLQDNNPKPQKTIQRTAEDRSSFPDPGKHQSDTVSSKEDDYGSSSDSEKQSTTSSNNKPSDSAIFFDEKKVDPETPRQLFEIVKIFGKGMGMVAARDLERGERILVEQPLIRHGRQFDDSEVIDTYNKLSEPEKSQIAELHNTRPEKQHSILGIIWTNTIRLSKIESGLFVVASRLNHYCAPNASHAWNKNLEAMTVHATKTIRKGEEITDSYLEGYASQADRRDWLANNLGFICDCSRCVTVGAEREQSDYRLGRIGAIHDELALALPTSKPAGAPIPDIKLYSKILRLLNYYETEGISDSRPAKAYVYAWLLSCRKGLGNRVVESARRAFEIYLAVKGDDHTDTVCWRSLFTGAQRQLRAIGTQESGDEPPEDEQERKLWLFGNKGGDAPEDWGDLYTSAGKDSAISKGEWSMVRRFHK